MALGSLASRTSLNVCTVVIMLFFTGLRIWILQSQKKAQGRSAKKTELFSLACLIWCTVSVIIQVTFASIDQYRLERSPIGHTDTFQLRPDILRFDFMQNTFHTSNVWIIKGAYLAAFWEVHTKFPKPLMYLFYVACAYTLFGGISSVLMHLLWCVPISRNWHLEFMDGKIVSCNVIWSIRTMGILTGMNIISDVLILSLGVAIVHTIQVTRRAERAALTFIFLIASLSLVATIGRYIAQVALSSQSIRIKATQELLVRQEIIFATAAYGLTFPRVWLRPVVRTLKRWFNEMKPELFSISNSGKDTGRSASHGDARNSQALHRSASTVSLRGREDDRVHELDSIVSIEVSTESSNLEHIGKI